MLYLLFLSATSSINQLTQQQNEIDKLNSQLATLNYNQDQSVQNYIYRGIQERNPILLNPSDAKPGDMFADLSMLNNSVPCIKIKICLNDGKETSQYYYTNIPSQYNDLLNRLHQGNDGVYSPLLYQLEGTAVFKQQIDQLIANEHGSRAGVEKEYQVGDNTLHSNFSKHLVYVGPNTPLHSINLNPFSPKPSMSARVILNPTNMINNPYGGQDEVFLKFGSTLGLTFNELPSLLSENLGIMSIENPQDRTGRYTAGQGSILKLADFLLSMKNGTLSQLPSEKLSGYLAALIIMKAALENVRLYGVEASSKDAETYNKQSNTNKIQDLSHRVLNENNNVRIKELSNGDVMFICDIPEGGDSCLLFGSAIDRMWQNFTDSIRAHFPSSAASTATHCH